jgi:hypothetical protein
MDDHRLVDVGGIRLACRVSGPPHAPPLKSEANGIPPAFQHLHARAVDAEAAAQALREDNGRLRERVAVYAQVIHELRTELDRRTDNSTQRSPVRSLPTSIT